MRARALFGVVSAFALATAASADAPDRTSPWEGFGVGSWVHLKSTAKTSGPGLAMPEEASETRETVVKVTDDAHTTKQETKTKNGWEAAGERSHPRRATVNTTPDEREDLGTEKIAVEGKAFECKKIRTHVANTITTTWTSKANGVLKTEIDSDVGGGRTTESHMVTALTKKVKLAGKDLVCRETTSFVRMELPGAPPLKPGDGTTSVELESDAVPGRRVRMEMSGVRAPLTRTSLEELVAFEAKPP